MSSAVIKGLDAMSVAAVTLDDKYVLESGRVYLNGTQALVRLPMMQRQRDAAAGLKTGCYISGYRGSPLGAYDMALWQARGFLKNNDIHFQPGVNEDLAATALWGSQQLDILNETDYDGVFGVWYGKGPGVDRTGDAFRHANLAGTSPHGGILVLLGDDHTAKSSTTAHQSDYAMVDAMIPVLNPAGVQEFLDLGLHGWAMSRFAGTWVGFKCVTVTVDSSASVQVDPHRVEIVTPDDFDMPEGGLSIRWPDHWLEQEERLHRYKLAAAKAYARANGIDRLVIDAPDARIGIVTAGKSYLDVRQAFEDLGLDEAEAAALGIRLYKPALTWPLEEEGLRRFARGLEEIVVVEEKRGLMEDQIKSILYNGSERPARIIGKQDEAGETLFPSYYELTPEGIALALADRIGRFHGAERFDNRVKFLRAKQMPSVESAHVLRTPYFCSGCPHNTSTKVPEGSQALAGIGCHFLAQYMNRETATFTHMGAEGATWLGQTPFNENRHIFVNLGDGTYFHSGFLAIRAAVAAGANMTYKILFNDAVAMTGGQPVDGNLTVPGITFELHGEGVKRIAVVSDEPEKYPLGTEFAPGVTIHHRDDLDTLQKSLREWPGVSAMIYDQTCASEKRRRRKRGKMVDPARRAFINDAVCEGCGDCSTTSNCVSVEPLETEFGRKRQINQSSCNKDFSCIKGFCPSFVTIEGGHLRRPDKPDADEAPPGEALIAALPDPTPPALDEPYRILVTGVGGTGVVTVGALIGMAAHMEGKGCSVLDLVGVAQKGGPVLSHIKIAARPEQLHSVAIGTGSADLLLGCDLVVAAGAEAMAKVTRGVSHAVINSHETPVAAFIHDPDMDFEGGFNQRLIAKAVGEDRAYFFEATRLATALFGDSIASNLFMLGIAFQKGLVPISAEALIKAIALNGVAVDMNTRAFGWGRLAAHDIEAVRAVAEPLTVRNRATEISTELDDIVARRVEQLTAYQDAAYARRYTDLVERVKAAEAAKAPGLSGLAEAVARYAYKLMAYKDEYEVARLHSNGSFLRKIRETFDGDYKIRFHMAPPLLASRDPETGHLQKRSYGAYMITVFKLMARLKGLRGTPFDIFGYTAERRAERQLIADYFATAEELLAGLDHDSHALAVQIAEIPEHIRGFGHIKEQQIKDAKAREADLLDAFRHPEKRVAAAE